jgi:hypothetical protein
VFNGGTTLSENQTSSSFVANQDVQKVAEAYTVEAINFSQTQFGIKLDGTDSSVANVEKALALLHSSYSTTKPKPTEEQIMSFAKALGSYVGEVYRRNHGAEWGIVTLDGEAFPGMQSKSGTTFWPWVRAFNRITQGEQDNMADYYKLLITEMS